MSDHIVPESLPGDFLSFISQTAAPDDFQGNYDITGLVLSGYRVLERILVNSGVADVYRCCRLSGEKTEIPAPSLAVPEKAVSESSESPAFSYENSPSFILKLYRREQAIAPGTAAVLATLKCSRVAPVLVCGTFHNRQYTITPFFRYPALDRVLAGGGTFSEEVLKGIIIPAVVAGLRDLHNAGIRHGNLSPAAIVPDNSGTRLLLTGAGVITDSPGRPGCSSLGAGETPRRDDYQALGLTVYELFTGFLPPPFCFRNRDSELIFPEKFPQDLRCLVSGLCRKGWGEAEIWCWLGEAGISVPGAEGETAEEVSPVKGREPPPESSAVRTAEASGSGVAVLEGSDLRFRNAAEFRSHIRRLYEAGKCYELRSLMNNYQLALKDVAVNVWHADVYEELDGMVKSLIQLGEHLFRNEEEFAGFLGDLLSENRDTPLNLGYFVQVHRNALESLKERPALSGIIGRAFEYAAIPDRKPGTILIDGISYPRCLVQAGEPGTYLEFGSFRQQNKEPDSPKTPVEWLVLDRTFEAALIISRQALDFRPCHHSTAEAGPGISWENHDIRKWLNGEFLEEAFSEEERRHIIKTRLVTGKNREYDTAWGGGGITEDRVFFLSIDEAEKYFKGSIFRKCRPNGMVTSKKSCCGTWELATGFCDWWLRSPGGAGGWEAGVLKDGSISYFGCPVSSELGVRPALWIRLIDMPE